MSALTSIEWTDRTWNPVRGCSRVSEGCRNCYAERVAHRFSGAGQPYHGLTVIRGGRPGWSGNVRLVREALWEPMRWKKPARVFVNSMSDLLHESLFVAEIGAVVGVMALARRHTFQVLTKRAYRLSLLACLSPEWVAAVTATAVVRDIGANRYDELKHVTFPLPNVHLGVSVENQAAADERIPILQATRAALRFLSVEPLLEYVNLRDHLDGIGWVIVGGESGPDARFLDVRWVRAIVAQCRERGVPVFVKQLGSHAGLGGGMRNKGNDPAEWPEDLRVREFPAPAAAAAGV